MATNEMDKLMSLSLAVRTKRTALQAMMHKRDADRAGYLAEGGDESLCVLYEAYLAILHEVQRVLNAELLYVVGIRLTGQGG